MLNFDPSTIHPTGDHLLCTPLKSPGSSGRILLAPTSIIDIPFVKILAVGPKVPPDYVGQYAKVNLTRGRKIHGSDSSGNVGRSYIMYELSDLEALIELDPSDGLTVPGPDAPPETPAGAFEP